MSILLGAVSISVSLTAGVNAAGPNLVFNPGFENDGGMPTTADGWELFSAGGLAERQTVMPHTGLAEVLLEGDPNAGANFAVIVQRELPVAAGTDYAMSFFAEASAVDGNVGYRLEFYNDSDSLIGGMFDLNVFIQDELTSAYQRFSSIFTAPPTAATGTIVMFWELLNGLTSVNWDDVYFGTVSADFDGDGDVDGDDFLIWQSGFGNDDRGDANADGVTDGDDFLIWQTQFGSGSGAASSAVPEPSTLALGFVALMTLLWRRPNA